MRKDLFPCCEAADNFPLEMNVFRICVLIIAPSHDQTVSTFAAEQYREWAKTFGPVFQVQLGNRPVIVVNDCESAKALFLTQTSSLVSRPLFPIFHGVVFKNVESIGTSPWSDSCKNRRKLAAGALNRPKVQSYEPVRFSFIYVLTCLAFVNNAS